jgi:hypothetical protein
MIYFIVILIINTGSLGIVLLLRRKLHPLEILSYWGCVVTIEQQLNTIISLNLKYVQLQEGAISFWSFKLNSIFLHPALTLLLFTVYFSKTSTLFNKVILTAGWLFLMYLSLFLHTKYDILKLQNWSFASTLYSLLGILAVSFGFALFFRSLLRRERILT